MLLSFPLYENTHRKSIRKKHAKKGRPRSHLDTQMSSDGRPRGPKGLQSVFPRASFFLIFLGFFKTHRPRASPTPPGRLPAPPRDHFWHQNPPKIGRESMKNTTPAEALLIILGLVNDCQKSPMTTYPHTRKQTHAPTRTRIRTHTHTHTHVHTHTHTHTHCTHTHTHTHTLTHTLCSREALAADPQA